MEAIEARGAVKAAKEFILEMFRDEEIVELGLEELELVDEGSGVWEVTLGFRRGWQGVNEPNTPAAGLPGLLRLPSPKRERTYKTVRVRVDGKIMAMTHRDVSVSA